MDVISYGESKPMADNGTRDGRTQNRRVTVVVLIRPSQPSRHGSPGRSGDPRPRSTISLAEAAARETSDVRLVIDLLKPE